MKIMLKCGTKHARIICDTCSKLSILAQKRRRIFSLEQLSIICAVSLLLTFTKNTASGVLSFSIHHFYVSKYNQWERTQVYIRTFKKKQTKNERWKENHRKKRNYFIGMYATSQVRFFIAFVNILQCGMSNLIVLRGDQEMIWKVGVCNRPKKQENTVFLAPIIVLK